MNLPMGPTPFQREMLEFARTVVDEIDGKKVTTLDMIMKAMRVFMKDKPEFAKILLQNIQEASKAEQDFRMLTLREALAHKAEWGPKFALAAKLGRPAPPVYPHPDDIIIGPDNSVTFVGPITEADARVVDGLLQLREAMFDAARLTIAQAGKELPMKEARKIWIYVRRRYYRFSRLIPRRLKLPFPRFEPDYE